MESLLSATVTAATKTITTTELRNLEKNINKNVSLLQSLDSLSVSSSLSPNNRKRKACYSIISSIQTFLIEAEEEEEQQRQHGEVEEEKNDRKESDVDNASFFHDRMGLIQYGYHVVLDVLEEVDYDYVRKSLLQILLCLSSSSMNNESHKSLYIELILNVLPYAIPEPSNNSNSNNGNEMHLTILQQLLSVFRRTSIEYPTAFFPLLQCLINLKKNIYSNSATANVLRDQEIVEFCIESITTIQEEEDFGKILHTMCINVLSSTEEVISFYKVWKTEYEKRLQQKNEYFCGCSILHLAHTFTDVLLLKRKLSFCLEYLLQQLHCPNIQEDAFGFYVQRNEAVHTHRPFSWSIIDVMVLLIFFHDVKYQSQIQKAIQANLIKQFKKQERKLSDTNSISSLLDVFHYLLDVIKEPYSCKICKCSDKLSICKAMRYQLLSTIFEVCIFISFVSPSCHLYKTTNLPPSNIDSVSNLIRTLVELGCDDLRSEVIQSLLYWMCHAFVEEDCKLSYHPFHNRNKAKPCKNKFSFKRGRDIYSISPYTISSVSSQVLLHLACYVPCSFDESSCLTFMNHIFSNASNAYYSMNPILMHQTGQILSFLLAANDISHTAAVLESSILRQKCQELLLSPNIQKCNLGLVLSTHLITTPGALPNDEQKILCHCIFKRIHQTNCCLDVIRYGCHFLHNHSRNNALDCFRNVKQLLVSTGLVQEKSQLLLHDSVVLGYNKNPFINTTTSSKREIVFCLVDHKINLYEQQTYISFPVEDNTQANYDPKQSNPTPNSYASSIFCLLNTYLKLGRDVLKNKKNWSCKSWLMATLQLPQWPTPIEIALLAYLDDESASDDCESNDGEFQIHKKKNCVKAYIYEVDCIIPLLSSTTNRQLICRHLFSSKSPLDCKTVRTLFHISQCCISGISMLSAVLNQSYCKNSTSNDNTMNLFSFQLCKIYALKHCLEFCILLLKESVSLYMTKKKQQLNCKPSQSTNFGFYENDYSQSISLDVQQLKACLDEQQLFMINDSFLCDMINYNFKNDKNLFTAGLHKDDDIPRNENVTIKIKSHVHVSLLEQISFRIQSRRLHDSNHSLYISSFNELFGNKQTRASFGWSLNSIKYTQLKISPLNVYTISLVVTSTHTLSQFVVRGRHLLCSLHCPSRHTSKIHLSSIILATRCLSLYYLLIFQSFQLLMEDEDDVSKLDDSNMNCSVLKEFLSICDDSIAKIMTKYSYDRQRSSSEIMAEFFKKDNFDASNKASIKEIEILFSFFTNELFDSCDNVALATQILDILALITFSSRVMISTTGASSSMKDCNHVAMQCYKNVCWKMLHTIYPQKLSDLSCVIAPILGHLRTIHLHAPYLWKVGSRYATVDGSGGDDYRIISLALRNLTKEPFFASSYSLEIVFSFYCLLNYWSIVALTLEYNDTNHEDTLQEWDEFIHIFVDYVSSFSKSKTKQDKKLLHRCSIPMITYHSFDKFFEILWNMTLASLSVSHIPVMPHVATYSPLSKEDGDTTTRDSKKSPYSLMAYYISCITTLLQTYASNYALFPSTTCRFVLKSSLVLNKILEVIIQRCIRWRSLQPVPQKSYMERQENLQPTAMQTMDYGSVFFLPPMLDSIAYIVEMLLDFCDFLFMQSNNRKDDTKNPLSYSSREMHSSNNSIILSKKSKLISMVKLRSEKLLDFLKSTYLLHNLPIPKKYFPNNNDTKQQKDNEIGRPDLKQNCSKSLTKRRKLEASTNSIINDNMPSSPSSCSYYDDDNNGDFFHSENGNHDATDSSCVEFEVIGSWG